MTTPLPSDHHPIDVARRPHTERSDARDRALSALRAERRRLQRVVAELEANDLDQRSEEDDLAEVASTSQHPADVASETFEREVELGLLDEFRAALEELELARRRVDDGTYGTCERCHEPIGAERLVAVPATRWCVSCAELVERESRWHIPPSRRGVLVDDEFLARDDRADQPGGDDDLLSSEEAAVTVRDLMTAD